MAETERTIIPVEDTVEYWKKRAEAAEQAYRHVRLAVQSAFDPGDLAQLTPRA